MTTPSVPPPPRREKPSPWARAALALGLMICGYFLLRTAPFHALHLQRLDEGVIQGRVTERAFGWLPLAITPMRGVGEARVERSTRGWARPFVLRWILSDDLTPVGRPVLVSKETEDPKNDDGEVPVHRFRDDLAAAEVLSAEIQAFLDSPEREVFEVLIPPPERWVLAEASGALLLLLGFLRLFSLVLDLQLETRRRHSSSSRR